MKKGTKQLLAFLLVIIIFIVQGNPIQTAFADDKSDAQNKKNALEQEQSSKQADLEQQKKERTKTEKYIEDIDSQLTDVSTKLYEIKGKLEKKEKEIGETQVKLSDAEASIKVQYEDMKLRIRFMYENGNTEYVSMLLSSESISDFLNKAEYISKITEYDKDMLYKMQETKNTIETAKAKLVEDKATLTALETEQKDKQSSLNVLLKQKKTDLAKNEKNISDTEYDISSLSAEIDQESKRLSEIQRIENERKQREEESRRQASYQAPTQSQNNNGGSYVPPSSPSKGNGSYIWPLPSQYRTRRSSFGNRPDPFGSGATVYHCGDDYPAPTGTPIYAVADGVVDSSQYSSSTGNCVVINHGGGLSSVYMHASVLIAKAGQSVKQGDVIALVGSTGPSTGPHLHISFRLNGNWVDPKIYIGG